MTDMMTHENDDPDHKEILPGDVETYPAIFSACASLIATSRYPRLAAVLLLNASLQVALEVLGREKLTHDQGIAIGNLEMAAAEARGALS